MNFDGKASQLQERLRLEAERREECKTRLSRPRCRTDVEKEVKILSSENWQLWFSKRFQKGESKARGSRKETTGGPKGEKAEIGGKS